MTDTPQTLSHDYLTVAQTAAYLQCHPQTVMNYLRAGVLKSSQLVAGGRHRISSASIEKLLEKSTTNFHVAPKAEVKK